jgi:hypothetical protein
MMATCHEKSNKKHVIRDRQFIAGKRIFSTLMMPLNYYNLFDGEPYRRR